MEKVFSKRLRQLWIQKKVKQTQMSRELHMTDSYIYNIEAGIAYPSMSQFFSICEYFGLTPAEFMKFDTEYTSKEEALLEAVKNFSEEKIDQLIRIAKTM